MKVKIEKLLNNNKIYICVSTLFIIVGIIIRLLKFGQIPGGVHQDEAMAAVDALALATHGTDRYGAILPVHFTAWQDSQMSVLLSYCMIPFIKLFGFSTVSIRIPSLIFSIIGIIALFLLTDRYGDRCLALFTLFMCVVNPWHFMQSRWAIDCNLFPHLFVIATLFLVIGFKEKWLIYFSMVFYGLCCYAYAIADYSLPIFLVIVAIFMLREKIIKFSEILIAATIYMAVSLPEYLTMIINAFGLKEIKLLCFTLPRFPESNRANDILFMNFSFKQLGENILSFLNVVFFKGDTTVSSTITEFGPIYYITTVFFIMGLVVILTDEFRCKFHNMFYNILLSWLMLSMWIGCVTNGALIHRVNVVFYLVIIVSSIGIVWLGTKVKVILPVIVCLYTVLGLLFGYTYFKKWVSSANYYYFKDFENALEYAKDIECDKYYIYSNLLGRNDARISEILTLYVQQIDAEYFNGTTNILDGVERSPYVERYNYVDAEDEIADEDTECKKVYIIKSADEYISLFSSKNYNIVSFGEYCVAY